MSDEINMTISIPTDDDGYVLLQCEHCGTYFKATPSNLKDDGVLHIFCPSCGLISVNYITEDVLELAVKMVTNAVNDMIYNEFKKWNGIAKRESLHLRSKNVRSMKMKILFIQESKQWKFVIFRVVNVLRKSNHY